MSRAACRAGCGRDVFVVPGMGAFEVDPVEYLPGVVGVVVDVRRRVWAWADSVAPAPALCNPRHRCPAFLESRDDLEALRLDVRGGR